MSAEGKQKGGRTVTVQVQLDERWVAFLAGAQTITGMGMGRLLVESMRVTVPHYTRLLLHEIENGRLPAEFDVGCFDVGLTRAERKQLQKAVERARVIQAGRDRVERDRAKQDEAKRRAQAAAIFGDRTSAPDR